MSEQIAERAGRHGRFAIETEFVSERRYQALLCLAQGSVPDPDVDGGVRTDVLDPLNGLDPAPLAAQLADPEVEVVMHAGRQDVAILRRTWETDIRNVFDTQVGAGFLGLGSQESYESLVRRVLKVRLSGAEGFTRWDRRPLSDQQLAYARDDARMLLSLGEELERRLDERGRLAWARAGWRALGWPGPGGGPAGGGPPPTAAPPTDSPGGARYSAAWSRASARWPASSS